MLKSCDFQCAKTTFTVLEETVRAGSGNLEIIKHEIIQKMIDVKWRQFGRRGVSILYSLLFSISERVKGYYFSNVDVVRDNYWKNSNLRIVKIVVSIFSMFWFYQLWLTIG